VIGAAVGVEGQVVVLPRVSVGFVAGRWAISTPPGVPALPRLFAGVGARWMR
jgi:hypothetical protein